MQIEVAEALRARRFLRGDADGNGEVQITDPITILGYLFLGDAPPHCLEAADFNDDGAIVLTDAVASLHFQFLRAEPPASLARRCGVDGARPFLGCRRSACDDVE